MWRLCKLGYQHEPSLMGFAFGFALLAAVPDALLALWLALLGDGIVDGDDAMVRLAAFGLCVSAVATWFLRTVSTRIQRRFRDKVTIALESHVAHLQASVVTVAHQERPELLDRLSVLRDQVFVLDHMYMSVFSTLGFLLRLGITVVLLASVDPALLLMGLFAIPTVITSSWRPVVERGAEEAGAPAKRLASHLFTTATTAQPGKEVRVTGIGPRLITQRREAWEGWYGPVAAARWRSALWHSLAWAIFGAAYVGGVVYVAYGIDASAGAVLLVLAAGSRLSAYIGATVGEIGFLRGIWMDGSQRLAWLEDYAAAIDGRRRPARAGAAGERDHLRGRVVRLPRHRPPRAPGRVPDAAGRGGRGGGGGERRRQDHAREAPGEAVRADERPHPRRRRRPGADVGDRVARTAGRRLPGLLPLRAARSPERRPRRRGPARRRAGHRGGGRSRRRR